MNLQSESLISNNVFCAYCFINFRQNININICLTWNCSRGCFRGFTIGFYNIIQFLKLKRARGIWTWLPKILVLVLFAFPLLPPGRWKTFDFPGKPVKQQGENNNFHSSVDLPFLSYLPVEIYYFGSSIIIFCRIWWRACTFMRAHKRGEGNKMEILRIRIKSFQIE